MIAGQTLIPAQYLNQMLNQPEREEEEEEIKNYITADVVKRKRTSKVSGRSPFAHRVSLHDILHHLKLCGWYWGELSSEEADSILHTASDGSFILRDSSDACHLFTLSLKAHRMVISVRVHFSRGLFKLDSSTSDCPSFHSVVDLIYYYLSDSHRFFYVDVPGYGEVRVTLKHPILKEVLPLQHLCCISIVRSCRTQGHIETLPLPAHLKRLLLEFCSESSSS